MNKATKTLYPLIFKPNWQPEGDGARVFRVIGNQHLRRLDPFLMLDYFNVKLPAGFPDHPHRGFETVTYMLKGQMHHQDFKGHKGVIGPGDLQWMTAGKGILHAEMPGSFDEPAIGFQLWINLKSNNKLINPQYQEYKSNQIPFVKKEAATIKVISGEWEGVKGPIVAKTPAYYFDVELNEKGSFSLDIPKNWNSIIFVYGGEGLTYDSKHNVPFENVAVLDQTLGTHKFTCSKKANFVLIAGEPLNEPIESYGPFVMNTRAQIQQTFMDYEEEKNGFEGARTWGSKIRHMSRSRSKGTKNNDSEL